MDGWVGRLSPSASLLRAPYGANNHMNDGDEYIGSGHYWNDFPGSVTEPQCLDRNVEIHSRVHLPKLECLTDPFRQCKIEHQISNNPLQAKVTLCIVQYNAIVIVQYLKCFRCFNILIQLHFLKSNHTELGWWYHTIPISYHRSVRSMLDNNSLFRWQN